MPLLGSSTTRRRGEGSEMRDLWESAECVHGTYEWDTYVLILNTANIACDVLSSTSLEYYIRCEDLSCHDVSRVLVSPSTSERGESADDTDVRGPPPAPHTTLIPSYTAFSECRRTGLQCILCPPLFFIVNHNFVFHYYNWLPFTL